MSTHHATLSPSLARRRSAGRASMPWQGAVRHLALATCCAAALLPLPGLAQAAGTAASPATAIGTPGIGNADGGINRNPARRNDVDLTAPAAPADPRDSTSRPASPQGLTVPDPRDTPAQPLQPALSSPATSATITRDPTRPIYDTPTPTPSAQPSPAGVPGKSAMP